MTDNVTPVARRRRGSAAVHTKWKQMPLRIPPELHARLQAQAEAQDVPDVDYVRAAIIEKLERDENAQVQA